MRIILGPFDPDLESAFVQEILTSKSADLLCPILVLTPSELLRRHLKILLTRERGLSLLHVQFLTFHQLALRLWEERSPSPLRLQSDLFLEEVLRRMIRRRSPGAEWFAGLEERAGGCAALWQTLRDLRDGLVDPAVALDAFAEGHFSRRAADRTAALLQLSQSFQQLCARHAITDRSHLFGEATRQASQSTFLHQFSRIFYYGFYDLTQIQLDFFQSVARGYETTLFFPLMAAQPKHEGWGFAQRFYERYLQGLDAAPPSPARDAPLPAWARLFDDSESRKHWSFPPSWKARIFSTFGAADELSAAAKEILKLVDEGGIQFREIGIVARSLEPYGSLIKDVFDQHKIPVAGAFEVPLAILPLVKAVILLVNLRPRDFLRSHVIELVSSPHFRCRAAMKDSPEARPDLWDLATRELAIAKGAADWRRLRRHLRHGLELRQLSHDDEPRIIRIPAAQLALLAALVEALADDLLRLPDDASWQEYALLWKALLEKCFGIAREAEVAEESENSRIGAAILDILDELSDLDGVDDSVSLDDFARTFQHWLERSSLTEDRRNLDGVLVLNATAARGLSFRALFLLGMNEGVFPRTIREDAFLRDRDREILERDLGYKVSQKLAAFEEEKLLFSLLAGAARERLYCSYQRADDSGRALAPSWYLDELKRSLAESGHECETGNIPRGFAEKAMMPPFDDQALLTPKELAIRLSLQEQDPAGLIAAFFPLPALYQHGRRAMVAIEQSGARLLPYDGALSDFAHYWKNFAARGLSPTSLETYARCPFQFFARHVLGLAPLDYPEESLGPSPAQFGELGHAILNAFYQALIDQNYFLKKHKDGTPEGLLQSVAARMLAEYEESHPVGYALAWEGLKTRMIGMLRQVVDQDLAEMARTGFAPASLETDVTARLPENWPQPLAGTIIRGRMDRVDRRDDALRVIDYKFKFSSKPASQDKNLVRAALRGERLQPPFYYLLAQTWAEKHCKGASAPTIEADFYFIAPQWAGGPLVPSAYGSEGLAGTLGAQTKQTIADLAEGVRSGRFFINRGPHCGHCDAAPICRKSHPPSLWRAENDPASEAHRALRKKASSDDEQDTELD